MYAEAGAAAERAQAAESQAIELDADIASLRERLAAAMAEVDAARSRAEQADKQLELLRERGANAEQVRLSPEGNLLCYFYGSVIPKTRLRTALQARGSRSLTPADRDRGKMSFAHGSHLTRGEATSPLGSIGARCYGHLNTRSSTGRDEITAGSRRSIPSEKLLCGCRRCNSMHDDFECAEPAGSAP